MSRSTLFLFVQKFLSPSVTSLCLAKLNLVYKLKDFSAMLGGSKRNSYVIPVWSGTTVLEMLSVESPSLMWPIYMALRLKPLTESDCRAVSHDSKSVYSYTARCCLTPTTTLCSKFSLFTFLRRV